MHTGAAIIRETFLDEKHAAHIACASALIPAPGQYVLAYAPSSGTDNPLATPVFPAGSAAGGFYAAPPIPNTWTPETTLHLRGPLGKGFNIPAAARAVALVAMGETPTRLLSLLEPALAQNASVALVCERPPLDLPAAVEIMPPSTLPEVAAWADYIAIDIPRDRLHLLETSIQTSHLSGYAQVLVSMPMPCGALGDCGACAVTFKKGWKLACKDGPVFNLQDLY